MTIHHRLHGMETRIAEEMTSVLDFLSRIQQGLEQGNWHYVEDKIHHLVRAAERLSAAVGYELEETRAARRARPEAITAAIRQFARHYHAGRALYPVDRNQDAATTRVLLDLAARDLQAHPPHGVSLVEADRVAEILRRYAAGEP